jgi:hypothetical protein
MKFLFPQELRDMLAQSIESPNSFEWWEGVVEDNRDPTGAGRCKIRVIAYNTPSKVILPTSELPWAYPLMPLNNPHGKIVALKPGTRVFGFYRDGMSGQDLVMMGTINIGYENPGKRDNFDEEVDPPNNINIAESTPRIGEVGFADDREGTGGPIATEPKKAKVTIDDTTGKLKHEDISDYGALQPNEINTPRLQRGIPHGTATAAHALSRGVAITPAALEEDDKGKVVTSAEHPYVSHIKDGEEYLSEPENPFKAQYPFNTVEESDSGHLREIDDTPGHERIKETHRTGTFYEIHPDGSKVTRIVKDNYEVTVGDDFAVIEGRCSVYVEGKADFYCLDDINVKTERNATVTATQDATVYAKENVRAIAEGGSATVSAGKNATVTAQENATVEGKNHVSVLAGGDMAVHSVGILSFKDNVAGDVTLDRLKRDIDRGRRVD